MKKIVYGILACIILIGAIITFTIGLNVDITYKKNVEIDIYIGKEINEKEIKDLAKEAFPNEKLMIQKVEMFNDMVSIKMEDRADEELKDQIEQLKTKINEKYGTEIKTEDDITIVHNPKIKLTSILKPYLMPIGISAVIIIIFVAFRYKKLGMIKTIGSYILFVGVVELVYLSLLAITRFPINRLVIPIGLVLYIITLTTLSFKEEKQLLEVVQEENTKKNKKSK